jgi:DNA-binding NtrC family response regulator
MPTTPEAQNIRPFIVTIDTDKTFRNSLGHVLTKMGLANQSFEDLETGQQRILSESEPAVSCVVTAPYMGAYIPLVTMAISRGIEAVVITSSPVARSRAKEIGATVFSKQEITMVRTETRQKRREREAKLVEFAKILTPQFSADS